MAPPPPPTEPQAEEMLAFQRLLQSYAALPQTEVRAKLIAQVHTMAVGGRAERASIYAFELLQVFVKLNDVRGVISSAKFISKERDRLALEKYLDSHLEDTLPPAIRKRRVRSPSAPATSTPPTASEQEDKKPLEKKTAVMQPLDPTPLKKSLQTHPTKEGPSSRFDRHRLFLRRSKQKSLRLWKRLKWKSFRLYVHIRNFCTSIPKPWIK